MATHFDHLEFFGRPEKWQKLKADIERGYPSHEEAIAVLEKMIPQAKAFLKELKDENESRLPQSGDGSLS